MTRNSRRSSKLCGERGTALADFWNASLGRKLTRLTLLGFFSALLLFLALFFLGNWLLDDYFSTSAFIYNAEIPYIQELKHYIEEEHLSATDTPRLDEWFQKKHLSHFTVSRENSLIYDSAYSDVMSLGQARADFLNYNWMYFHTVTFADGDADVYIYADYDTKFYLLLWMLDTFVSICLWILIFTIGVRKEVAYIQQLSQSVQKIELGSMDCEVMVKGKDELGRLAIGLDRMRLALIEKEHNEQIMKAAQDKLVLGMAHDLRTPLTGLMTFLDISRKQNRQEDTISYLDKSYDKALQIRSLSDQMFDFFLINSEKQIHLEEPESAESALGDYLSELCALLQMDGFSVSIEHLSWEPIQIQICTDYMGRIMDNLVSNIKKYADRSAPVELSSAYSDSEICITLKNMIAEPEHFVHGTGIGTKNIKSMMEQMHGSCKIDISSEQYIISLSFPIYING